MSDPLSTVLALCVDINAEEPGIFMRQVHQSTRSVLRSEKSRSPPRLVAGRVSDGATVCWVTETLGSGANNAGNAGRKAVSTATAGAVFGANARIAGGEDVGGTDNEKRRVHDAGHGAEAAEGSATGAATIGRGAISAAHETAAPRPKSLDARQSHSGRKD